MKKYLFTVILSAVFIFLIGSSAVEATAQSISLNGSIGAIKRGGAGKGAVVLNIPDGLHVNSNRPDNEYSIPTSVKVGSNAAGVKLSAVSYPRGQNRKFSFSDNPINVYEGRAVFGFNVTVPQNFKGNVVKIRAVVRYQACTDEVCYAPKTQEITLTAKVK